jgi:hypothetical protein
MGATAELTIVKEKSIMHTSRVGNEFCVIHPRPDMA